MKYKALFTKGNIGNVQLKNRVALAPMVMGTGTPSGVPSEQMMAYYEERAKGGVGLIITEATRVEDRKGVLHPLQLAMSRDSHIAPFSKMVERVHKHGSKIFCQLHHPGRQNYSILMETLNISQPVGKAWSGYWDVFFKVASFSDTLEKTGLLPAVVAPSAVPCDMQKQKTRALRKKEILNIVSAFGSAALRVKKSGADGVELHAAHGYLIQQFLSPHTNRRTDEYGGSFENRMRFITEIIQDIQDKCGKDFPLTVRLSVDEFYSKIGKPNQGITLPDGIRIAKELERLGVAGLNVSGATYETKNYWLETVTFDIGWRAYLAKAIKDVVDIPVLAANNVRTPEQAEKHLEQGVQDFVCLARPLLADPDWVNKAENDKADDIVHCISCLWCFESMLSNGFIGLSGECAVNPRACREYRVAKEPAKDGNGRTVAVIGAGPSGLMASKMLGKRDFKPVLFEKNNKVGGQLLLANQPPKKEKIAWCVDDLERDALAAGAEIRLATKATIKELKALNPYAIFLASGAKEMTLRVQGIEGDNVFSVEDVLSGRSKLSGKNVAVIGSGMTGLETAEYLASGGNNVTIVEMLPELAPGVYHQHTDDILPKLRELNVKMLTNRELTEIRSDEIVYVNRTTNHATTQKMDAVVLSVGVCPENEMENALRQNFDKVFTIGDAKEIGRIGQATRSAFDVALLLK